MKTTYKRPLAFFLLALPFIASAQDTVQQSGPTYFSNALFNALLILIVFLAIVIVALGQVLKNVAQSDIFLKDKKENDGPSINLKGVALFFFLLSALSLSAQTTQAASDWRIGGIDAITFYFMLTIIIIENIVIVSLYLTIMKLIRSESAPVAAVVKKRTILDQMNASVDIEKEADIMMDHEYDGIRELDNDLPPWWKYGFYVTIFFAFIYLINYHIAGTGDLQNVEYEKSVAQAKAEVEEYMRTAASNVDETTVKMLGESDIATGKDVFISNCAACHGKEGQGGVGPNMTDAYWLHGGSVVDIFKSIKYGWVDKGMKSWKEDLSPMQIAQVTSFIKSIVGTTPAGAKAPQGDIYKDEQITNDSTQVKVDSLVVIPDTLKK